MSQLLEIPYSSTPRCVILGAGGHAAVLIDTLLLNAQVIIHGILTPDEEQWGRTILGVPILGNDDRLPGLVDEGVTHFVVGVGSVGDNTLRRRLYEYGIAQGYVAPNIIHPRAICSQQASIGQGVQILAGAIINPMAKVGDNVIINTGAIVEHDNIIGNHVHIATGARLSGTVVVGDNAHIGTGATIRQSISIGENAVVGAGTVVIADVPDNAVVVGVPARVIRYKGK